MRVATFGPSTGWAGRTVTYEAGRLVLEGYGQVAPQALLDYARQGQIVWAHEGLREWVESLVEGAKPTPRPSAGVPVWAIAIIVSGVVVLVGGFCAAIAIPVFVSQRDKARVISVKEGIREIQTGIQDYADGNDDSLPDPAVLTRSGLDAYVSNWPRNPYTGRPMTQGHGPGDFSYSVYDNGLSFELIGYVANGTAIIVVRREAISRTDADAIREGVHSIKVGIESYAVDKGALPDPSLVTESGLGTYVDTWPANPYTGLPMTPGTSAGDYVYTIAADGHSYRLVGYGDNRSVIAVEP